MPLSVSASDGLIHFGQQIILANTWTHSAPFTGEKSQLSCCLATGIPHASGANDGATELTATGTTATRPTVRSAFIIRRSFEGVFFFLKNHRQMSMILDLIFRSILSQFVMEMKSYYPISTDR